MGLTGSGKDHVSICVEMASLRVISMILLFIYGPQFVCQTFPVHTIDIYRPPLDGMVLFFNTFDK